MLSFLRRLKCGLKAKSRTLLVSVICIATVASSGILTGITAFASRVDIYDDGKLVKTVLTNSESAEEILNNNGISVSLDDKIICDEEGSNFTIEVLRAFDVEIEADDCIITVAMVDGTVQDALVKSNIYVGETDIVSEELDQEVFEDMKITVTRVTTDVVSEEVEIPYNTVTKETNQLLKGKTQVETAGQNGVQKNYYSCVYEDGVEVSRSAEPISSEVTQQPVDEVILVGTLVQKTASSSGSSYGKSELALPADVTLDANGIPENYSNVITGRGVAYTASAGARTSTGRTVKPGYVAVNPDIIPYGTELYIVASDGSVYGYAIAADTGGSAMANTILVDLFMNTTAECYAWGSRTVNIYVLS